MRWLLQCFFYKKKLTPVYNRYPCEKPLMERVFVKAGQGLIHMWHRSNYDWMLFL